MKNIFVNIILLFAPLFGGYVHAQDKVTGQVRDAEGGGALKGVVVNLLGSDGVSGFTDDEGMYSLPVSSKAEVMLEFAYAGYESRTIYINGRSVINVNLVPAGGADASKRHATSRGSLDSREYAGAAVTLTRDQIMERGYGTLDNALQGMVPGLYAVSRSGTSASGTSMSLRGMSTLSSHTRPLLVVDGVIFETGVGQLSSIDGFTYNPLSNIQIRDIDRVTVIKDGVGANYGALGSNGVILVTTKETESNKTRVDFSANVGVISQPEGALVMDATSFQNYALEQLSNRGYSYSYLQSVYPFLIDQAEGVEKHRYSHNTDWQDLTQRAGTLSDYSVNIQGGDNVASYNISVGYKSNEDVIENAGYESFDFLVNAKVQMTPTLVIKPRVVMSRVDSDLREEGSNGTTNPTLAAIFKSPLTGPFKRSEKGVTMPFYDEVGAFGMSNPVSLVDNAVGEHDNFRVRAGFYASQKIFNNLSLEISEFVDLFSVKEASFIPETGVVSQYNGRARNVMSSTQRDYYSILSEASLKYDKVFANKHHLNANGGLRVLMNKFEEESAVDINSPSDEFVVIGRGNKSLRNLDPVNGDWNMLSFFGNAGYSYKDKYYADLSISVDGSSKFSASERYGYFPVGAVAWRASSEPFLNGLTFLSDLKFRASFGLSGNDDIGYYSSRFYYVGVPMFDINGLQRGGIPSTNLTWEVNKQANFGMDLSLWNDRISLSLDYYDRRGLDLVTYEQPEVYYGSDYLLSNSGEVSNKGFEMALNVGVVRRKDFTLDMGMTLSANKNELVSLGPNALESDSWGRYVVSDIKGGQLISREGSTVNAFFGYETKGVISSTQEAEALNLKHHLGDPFRAGDVLFVDQNGDNIIDENDRVELGDPMPEFFGSFNMRARYKRLRFSMLWDYVYGNEMYNNVRSEMESMDNLWNQSRAVERRWRQEGQQTDMPKATMYDPMGNSRFSDRWIEDASFIRLKNISVSYDFNIKNKVIRSLSAYVVANNVITFTDYLGATPDVAYSQNAMYNGVDYGKVPLTRSMMLGIKLGI
ncbi:SusC/RagA family TonB-linked outer membrane protein (plasmid) [Fulvitalea axinellae]|uniref:SusC/RagA family TonB-linked outer membrane protein n=1 Tax=Fulvitalea axinellae TaxID=1182444 RepID=A0AAU9D673_9BACT|nr:SusC/RagA family TonB-linked outer membrane protein [Fulvitalea axinellae]